LERDDDQRKGTHARRIRERTQRGLSAVCPRWTRTRARTGPRSHRPWRRAWRSKAKDLESHSMPQGGSSSGNPGAKSLKKIGAHSCRASVPTRGVSSPRHASLSAQGSNASGQRKPPPQSPSWALRWWLPLSRLQVRCWQCLLWEQVRPSRPPSQPHGQARGLLPLLRLEDFRIDRAASRLQDDVRRHIVRRWRLRQAEYPARRFWATAEKGKGEGYKGRHAAHSLHKVRLIFAPPRAVLTPLDRHPNRW
jgi:hypothetical protein